VQSCATAGATTCSFPLVIEEDVKAPVFVYYQLDNFYQNHRRYVKSKDPKQLLGQNRTTTDVKDTCTPVIMNADLNPGTTFIGGNFDITTNAATNTSVAWPCGLIAKSVFTDAFTLTSPTSGPIPIDSSNIAWKSDVEYKYKNGPDPTNSQWLDVTDRKSPILIY
jgi:hypothetical protein